MARIPNRKTLLKVCSAALLLSIAGGGVFFIFAPYQASRMRADIVARLHVSGEEPLVLATAAEDGAYFELGGVLRQHLDAYHSYPLEVRPSRGSVENLQLLHEGTADLALIQGGLTTERDGLVALANLGRQYLHLIVPADSNIEQFRDLAGKRIGVGPEGGGSSALANSVLGFFNFAEEAVLVHDHNTDLREAFLDGEIDAAFTVYSLFAPAVEQLLGEGWYRLVPMAEADAVSRYLPGVFMEALPANLYGPDRSIPPSTGVPFQTISVNTLLVAERDLPNRQVYTILELIFSGDFLKAARLTGLDESAAQAALHLPLHPAAEAFYNRHNPISADRFEILSFFLAGIVCLASVIHYVLGHHRHKVQTERRQAIRPYFEAMMDFGDEIEVAGHPAHLSRLIHKVMATQRGAEREWLEGHFDTEDMENLYAVYGQRCNNAFNKIFDLHLQSLRGLDTVAPARPPVDEGAGTAASFPRYERDNTPVHPRATSAVSRIDRNDSPVRPRAIEADPLVERDAPPVRPRVKEVPTAAVRDDDGQRPRIADVAVRSLREQLPTPKTFGDDSDYFSGSALAGIDTTKGELAERLPSRYDPTLLYDTEASGAGSVRVRKSKPQADFQAVVEKDVPARPMAKPLAEPLAEPVRPRLKVGGSPAVSRSAKAQDLQAEGPAGRTRPVDRPRALPPQTAARPPRTSAAPPSDPFNGAPAEMPEPLVEDTDGGPDQLMLF